MKGEFRGILRVASTYMTTIIGAGFASGQEIMQFFSHYYEGGFYGIILAGVLFSLIGCIVLNKVYSERIRNYDELLFPMTGWALGWVVEIMVTLFILSIYCVMIAGSSSIISDKLGIPSIYSILLMSAVCMTIILTSIRGVVMLSTVVTPLLITGILLVGIYIIVSKDMSVFGVVEELNKVTHNWFFSAIIYASYNSLLSVVIMSSMLPYLKTKRIGVMGGVLGGLMLCIVALILNTAIFLFYPNAVEGEFPILSLIEKFNGLLSVVYTLVLWLAMLTSAVTSGYCAVERIGSRIKINIRIVAFLMCALAIPMSGIGFSKLISTIYPLFGYLGLFMILMILFQGLKALFSKKTLCK